MAAGTTLGAAARRLTTASWRRALVEVNAAGRPTVMLPWAAFSLAAGGAIVFAIAVLLGRPPIGWEMGLPTRHGPLLFFAALALAVALWRVESRLVAASTGLPPDAAASYTAYSYLPLALGWAAVAALYHPTVYHWYRHVPALEPTLVVVIFAPAVGYKLATMYALQPRALARLCWRYRYLLAGLGYAAIAIAAKPTMWHADLAGWFVKAARLIVAGQPFAIYAVRGDVLGTPAPIEHTPLAVFYYAPLIWLAELLGQHDFFQVAAVFPLAGVLLADCVMAYQATRLLRDALPQCSEQQRFACYVLLLFSPLVWFSSVWLVHLETLLVLLGLTAVRLLWRGRPVWAGLVMGLAFLVKQAAVLQIVPLLALLALLGRWRMAVRLGAAAAAVGAAGVAPFFIATPGDAWLNFFGYEPSKPIYGLTIWKALWNTGLESVVMAWATPLILALVTIAGLGFAWRAHRALGMAPVAPALLAAPAALATLGALVLAQLVMLGLVKWSYPHYFVAGFVFLLLWEQCRSGLEVPRALASAEGAAEEAAARSSAPGTALRWPVFALVFMFVMYNLDVHVPQNVGRRADAATVIRAVAELLFLYGSFVYVWIATLRTLRTLSRRHVGQ